MKALVFQQRVYLASSAAVMALVVSAFCAALVR